MNILNTTADKRGVILPNRANKAENRPVHEGEPNAKAFGEERSASSAAGQTQCRPDIKLVGEAKATPFASLKSRIKVIFLRKNDFSDSVKRGFTLLEILMALAISAFIMMGVYIMFSSTVDTQEGLNRANDDLIVREAVQRLVAKDIRMMQAGVVGDLPPDPQNMRLFAIVSHNSLTFNKAIPVDLIYEVDNSTLYRIERRTGMDYIMRLPLMDNITEWEVRSFSGSEYRDGFNARSRIYKFIFTYGGRHMEFTTGQGLGISL